VRRLKNLFSLAAVKKVQEDLPPQNEEAIAGLKRGFSAGVEELRRATKDLRNLTKDLKSVIEANKNYQGAIGEFDKALVGASGLLRAHIGKKFEGDSQEIIERVEQADSKYIVELGKEAHNLVVDAIAATNKYIKELRHAAEDLKSLTTDLKSAIEGVNDDQGAIDIMITSNAGGGEFARVLEAKVFTRELSPSSQTFTFRTDHFTYSFQNDSADRVTATGQSNDPAIRIFKRRVLPANTRFISIQESYGSLFGTTLILEAESSRLPKYEKGKKSGTDQQD
jgi:hypothetical protein